MNILLGFSPWLLFWFLAAGHPVLSAAGASLVLSLIVNARSFWRGAPKTLEIGSFIFLLLMTVLALFTHWAPFRHWSHAMVNAAVFLTSLVSILIKRPSIFEYVREEAPPEKRSSPELYRTCLRLTRMWMYLFLFMTVTGTAKVFWKHPVQWIIVGGHTVLFMSAMIITRVYRKRAVRSGQRSTAS